MNYRDKFSAGLELGAERDEIYGGFWGYNSLLTGAALGGNLLVLNSHTAIATMLAIVYTALLQFSIKAILMKVIGVSCFSSDYFYYALANLAFVFQTRLPLLTLPFVTATSMFLKLSDGKEDPTFPWPVSISSPEKQRYDHLALLAAVRDVRLHLISYALSSPRSPERKISRSRRRCGIE